jgi:hypothetical protein
VVIAVARDLDLRDGSQNKPGLGKAICGADRIWA